MQTMVAVAAISLAITVTLGIVHRLKQARIEREANRKPPHPRRRSTD